MTTSRSVFGTRLRLSRLRDGGLLVSHDVQMNAAFPESVAKRYAHDKKTGRRDAQWTSHHEWGRWGYIGFAKKLLAESQPGITRMRTDW